MNRLLPFLTVLLALQLPCPANLQAQTATKKHAAPAKKDARYDASVPTPTLSGVRYGTHERHVLDFWKAESDTPTPLVFVIHGGGWQGGDKERLHRFADTAALLEAGISVVAINYRYVSHAVKAGIEPPVKTPLHDAARALQFVRSKAADWNLDKERIGAAGGSAGACSSLWLAYHDDLSDPNSDDPVARVDSTVVRRSHRRRLRLIRSRWSSGRPTVGTVGTPSDCKASRRFLPSATISCPGSPSILLMRSSAPTIRQST